MKRAVFEPQKLSRAIELIQLKAKELEGGNGGDFSPSSCMVDRSGRISNFDMDLLAFKLQI